MNGVCASLFAGYDDYAGYGSWYGTAAAIASVADGAQSYYSYRNIVARVAI